MSTKPKVSITKDGPYLVSGHLPLQKEITVADEEGSSMDWQAGEKFPEQENYALCRCGHSSNKPYCDGTHAHQGFDGTETARREYSQPAETIVGPELV